MNKLSAWIRKNTATIGATTIVIAMGLIILVQTLALSKLETDIQNQERIITATKDLAASIDKDASDRNEQIQEINRHMDCIVQFFTNPDRTNKRIGDIESCTLKTDAATRSSPTENSRGNVVAGTNQTESTEKPAPTTVQQSQPDKTQPTQPAQPNPPARQPTPLETLLTPVNKTVDGIAGALKSVLK